jgi:hypothetical protein
MPQTTFPACIGRFFVWLDTLFEWYCYIFQRRITLRMSGGNEKENGSATKNAIYHLRTKTANTLASQPTLTNIIAMHITALITSAMTTL